MFDIWQARCNVPSEWDGGDQCMETVNTRGEAEKAMTAYQAGGHASWIVPHDEAY